MERRAVITALALSAAPLAISLSRNAFSQSPPLVAPTDVTKADQFYVAVLQRAELSLATSQLAVQKAKNKNAHEFAGFELGEAITVNMVLKDIGATAPKMDDASMGLIKKMKMADEGSNFDQTYIDLQLENHEALRDLADAYLQHSAGATDPAEMQGRHLGSLMLAVFKEHVAICKRISAEVTA